MNPATLATDLVQVLNDLSFIRAKPGETFTLASGAKSDFYIDCRKSTLSSRGLPLIVNAMDYILRDLPHDAVGGPTLGADPIIAGLLMLDKPRTGFIVRKETKAHGLQNLIEGNLRSGDRAVLVEDVATSGGSLLKAILAAEDRGAKVVKVMVVLDRLSGAAEMFQKRGYDFEALTVLQGDKIVPGAWANCKEKKRIKNNLRRRRLAAAGICRCGKMVEPGTKRCSDCGIKNNQAKENWRRANPLYNTMLARQRFLDVLNVYAVENRIFSF